MEYNAIRFWLNMKAATAKVFMQVVLSRSNNFCFVVKKLVSFQLQKDQLSQNFVNSYLIYLFIVAPYGLMSLIFRHKLCHLGKFDTHAEWKILFMNEMKQNKHRDINYRRKKAFVMKQFCKRKWFGEISWCVWH
jgi:hypothetical protein